MSSKNKIAIVTGASTGLGRSISVKLASHGYKIILISRNIKKLNQTFELIEKNGDNAKIIVADISCDKDVRKIYSQINLDEVEIIINNAGLGIFNKIEKVKVSEWDTQINTNLRGPFLMTRFIVKSMIRRKKGKLIFINSVAGINPYPNSSVYVASKYGLRGFAASLREELREHNIKVISVHPGSIDTPFWDNTNVSFPKDEMMNVEDVADSIIFAILAPNNIVQEEIVIRRTAGDF